MTNKSVKDPNIFVAKILMMLKLDENVYIYQQISEDPIRTDQSGVKRKIREVGKSDPNRSGRT